MKQLLDQIQTLNFPAPLPPTLLAVEQTFDAVRIDDVATATRLALQENNMLATIQPGETVAVGMGSRGVANIATIARETIRVLKEMGAQPFITPAMGSHAGATSDSQMQMLANLGVTRESVGAEIKATMDVREVGQVPNGPPLFQDLLSVEADHTLIINRIKPHTSFRSQIESGLAKMAVIGLGKQHGAAAMHARGVYGLVHYLAPAARVYERNTNLMGGLAIVENAYDETAEIHGLTAGEIGAEKEAALLERAKSLMPSLPFDQIEVLVVRQLGKNISGTGMDTNVISRMKIPRQPEPTDGPDIATIVVLDLTEATHGNAYGIGLANVVTARFAEQIDWAAVYTNALTSGVLGMWRTALPMTMADDRRAIQAGLRGCGEPQETARIVFIQDTLTVDKLWVSPSLRPEIDAHPRLRLMGEVPLAFDGNGVLRSPWQL